MPYMIHFDYCASLLAGCGVKVIARVQNNAARLICDQPHGSHSAPLLRQLHWLPITSRVLYKLCLLMYDVFHGTAPSYLTELCHVCDDDRPRSTQRGNFAVVRTRTRMADGAFTVAGPAAWNALPPQLRHATSRTVFYHISKLTCRPIIILTAHYTFFKFLLHQLY